MPHLLHEIVAKSNKSRHEIALDVAIMLLTRELKKRLGPTEKFSLCDASPMAGYDWLWSLFAMIAKEKLAPTFWAVSELKTSIEEYVSGIHATNDGAELSISQLTTVPDDWKPLLKQIKDSVILCISPPCAMTGGHTGLADKVSTEAYKMHLTTDPDTHLADEASSYRSNTADMGTEIGLCSFKLAPGSTAEDLLPPWLERRSLDNDVGDADSADGVSDELPLDVDDADEAPPVRNQRGPPKPSQTGGDFLPNGHTFAGLQHQTNNMNVDVNYAMPQFKEFFGDLKQLESLLRTFRCKTFVWTCIRKTRYAKYETEILYFDASLYEQRWHEVVKFLKKVKRLIIVVTQSFNARRFKSGLDQDGQAEATGTALTRQRKERATGFSEFDANRLERALGGAFFHFFCHLVLKLDSIPTNFAKENELCPCHKALIKGLDAYKIRLVFEAHYGVGSSFCPMGSKNLPELVDEGIEVVMDEQKNIMEEELKVFCPPPNVRPMTNSDWETLFDNMRLGYRASLSILQLKTDYIHRLPVSMGGLAVADEDRARANAVKVRNAFRLDPRRDVHDARTWKLMEPGCDFAVDLDGFIDLRKNRRELSRHFQHEIGIFRFIWVNETPAEERHAIAAVDIKRSFIGPVRISLSSRLPMFERWLKHGVVTGEDLLRCFTKARALLDLPDALGLSNHPTLKSANADGSKVKPAEMRVRLCKVLYRCDLSDMFRSQAKASKSHVAQKRKQVAPTQ